jgi:hypothetical protein
MVTLPLIGIVTSLAQNPKRLALREGSKADRVFGGSPDALTIALHPRGFPRAPLIFTSDATAPCCR